MNEKLEKYGLHNSNIEIQKPEIELETEPSGEKTHYLGERYVDNYNTSIEGTDESGAKELISVKNNTSTIFDKRKENTSTINENENYDEKNKVFVKGFDPKNTDSKFYTETFNFNNSKAKVINKYNVPVNYTKTDGNGVINGRTVIIDLEKATSKNEYLGASLYWDGKNWDNSITTNVDNQDDMLYDDIENAGSLSSLNLGEALGNSVKQLGNSLGAVKGAKNTFARVKNSFYKEEKNDRFSKLQEIKSKKYKNIKMSSTIGTYNSLENLLGFASGLFVGSLGKSAVTNLLDDATSKFTGGFGLVGVIERLSGAAETIPSLEDIISLNLANYYNMYTNRPGRHISNRYNRYNFITDDNSDKSLDGKKDINSIDNNILSKINKGINFVSNWADGSKISKAIGDLRKKINNKTSEKSTIISEKRDEETLSFTRVVDKEKKPIDEITDEYVEEVLKEEDREKLRKRFKRESDLNGNLLGGLYIEPYYCNMDGEDIVKCFTIPFEFNPKISDGGYEAQYQQESLLGRILAVRSYIGTDSKSITIETQYMALTDGNKELENSNFGTQNWMKYWSVNKLLEIENEYRMLVLPYIKDDKFIRPPIVRIQLGYDKSSLKVGDLFSYSNVDGALQVTSNLETATNEKRYIVTSLTINPLDDGFWYRINYDTNDTSKEKKEKKKEKDLANFYRGFKINMTLVETTKNFLDVIPNYWNYMQETKMVKNSEKNKNDKSKSTNNDNKSDKIYDIKDYNIKDADKIKTDLTSAFDIEEDNENISLIVRIYKQKYGE